MKFSNELKTTTNRAVFNKAYKRCLENDGKIHCSYSKYHGGDNSTNKFYVICLDEPNNSIYPNWKLVSKNRHQWMDKGYNLLRTKYSRYWKHYKQIEIVRSST